MPAPLTRFELTVVVRVQVSDLPLLRRYLGVEAAMEELANELGLDSDLAAMTGLGAAVDAQLCAANPGRRGEVAAEILRTENAPPEVIAAVRDARKGAPSELTPLAGGLLIADVLVGALLGLVADAEEADGDALAEIAPRGIVLAASLQGRRQANPDASRAELAAQALNLSLDRAAELVLAGVRRVRVDLGL